MSAYFEVKNVVKTYRQKDGTPFNAVDDLSFVIDRGEIFSVLGPNGAGKTTLINVMNGLLSPDSGHVLCEGLPISYRYEEFLGRIGAVLEGNRNIYWYMSAVDNLKYFGRLQFIPEKELDRRAHELLDFFDLKAMKGEKVGMFSRGMQQKVAICVALINKPSILFLDEPTLGLDVVTRESLLRRLKEISSQDRTSIILTTHNLDVVERISDRVLILNKGKKLHMDKLSGLKALFVEKAMGIHVRGLLTEAERAGVETAVGSRGVVKFQEKGPEDTVLKVSTTAEDYEETFRKIMAHLLGSGISVTSFAHEELSLEKVFLKIFGDGAEK